ncbi:MAG: S1/P1 nuclease [Aliiglaciecola sp.]|uniref:S1/P1 nuclease n=1 Tax=Aliiglaciecola sp. M165 TaxID=2593649 RepID=UPI00117CD8CB|nr:S1/P1 nuclease [Aliiglaciecola sp. M165]TRY33942.1 S1/P1 nuclease [Aliiglaciecola sp. M165]
MDHKKRFSAFVKLSAATLLLVITTDVLAWGQIGHRVTGELAEQYLTTEAKTKIAQLYPDMSLAEISTHADEMRSNPSEFWQKTANPWHYVTVPEGNLYDVEQHAPEVGDAYTALTSFTATLKSDTSSDADKRLALHFIVHIIGDLHQPFHAGDGTDRGGNDVKLEFFWEDSNLHRVWDSGLIDRQKLSYTEWTKWLGRKITPEMAAKWRTTDPKIWIKESIDFRTGLYPEGDRISWSYQYESLPIVKARLQMAGIRIAAYLNEHL